jgi:hypothetical protein
MRANQVYEAHVWASTTPAAQEAGQAAYYDDHVIEVDRYLVEITDATPVNEQECFADEKPIGG